MADHDFIEEMQEEAQLRFGKELTPEECALKFAGHDLEGRVYHLKNLKTDDLTSIRDAAKRLSYVRALNQTHEKLRRVGR